jgi:hypothetical protein
METIAQLFKRAAELGWFGKTRRLVTVEVRSAKEGPPWETIGFCRDAMMRAWDSYLSLSKA